MDALQLEPHLSGNLFSANYAHIHYLGLGTLRTTVPEETIMEPGMV